MLGLIAMTLFTAADCQADITIIVYGTGGLDSNGTTHQVCPTRSNAQCAKITMPSAAVKDHKLSNGTLTMVDGTVYKIERIKARTDLVEGENAVSGNSVSFRIIKPSIKNK